MKLKTESRKGKKISGKEKVIMERIEEYFNGQRIDRVLDLATGKGEFIGYLRQIAGKEAAITAVDINQKILDFAGKRQEGVRFLLGNACELDFEENSFDLTSLSNSLHHFEFPRAVAGEMKRVTRTGGVKLIQEMVCDEEQSEAQKSHIMLHHLGADIEMLLGRYHGHTWSSEKLDEFIREAFDEVLIRAEYSYEVEDEKNPELTGRYFDVLEYYKKVAGSDYDVSWEERFIKVREQLERYGFAPAKEVVYLLK